MQNLVPLAAEANEPARENRLVLRVLEVWRRARADYALPLVGSLDASDMGTDAENVFSIDLRNPAGPCFSQIGAAVRVAGWPGEQPALVAHCPEDSVLGLVSQHWREIVDRGVPVTRGGAGVHEGAPVLYRGVLMPLVDAQGRIVVIMGAANWRAVEESHGAPNECG